MEPFFETVRSYIKYLAIWPYDYKTNFNKFLVLFSVLNVLFMCGMEIGLEIAYLALNLADNNLEMLKTYGAMGFHVIVGIKLLHWIYNLPTLKILIFTLQRDSFLFDNFDLNSRFLQAGVEASFRDKKTASKMKERYYKCKYEGSKLATTIFRISMFLCSCSLFLSYFMTLTGNMQFLTSNIEMQVRLPYNSYHFLDMEDSFQFFLGAMYQCYGNVYMSYSFVAIDMCLIGLIIHITTQIKIVGLTFENINFERNPNWQKQQIRNCIEESKIIIRMMEMLDDYIKFILLEQYLIMTIIICTFVYVIPEDTDPTKMIGNVLFIFNMTLEPLSMGWFSQELTEEFGKLANSVYQMNWADADNTVKKNLAYIMSRLQNSVTITCGNFVPMNLNVYVFIMKTAYSFYTLLTYV